MRKKSGFSIIELPIALVPEFKKVVSKLNQQVTLGGQSKSTLQNYIRRIALFVVHSGSCRSLLTGHFRTIILYFIAISSKTLIKRNARYRRCNSQQTPRRVLKGGQRCIYWQLASSGNLLYIYYLAFVFC